MTTPPSTPPPTDDAPVDAARNVDAARQGDGPPLVTTPTTTPPPTDDAPADVAHPADAARPTAAQPAPTTERLAAARVLGAWGRNGRLRIVSLSGIPDRFAAGARFLIGEAVYESEGAWLQGKAQLIKLIGVDSRYAADALQGALLETPADEAPALPEGAYYHHQVIGLAVRTTDGRELGAVVDIIETGSNDVYVVRGPDGETLVPAIPDVVTGVDVAGGVITVEPVPGLL